MTCPPEILAEIFSIYAASFTQWTATGGVDLLSPSPIFDVVNLSRVNSYFRAIALQTPNLWTWFPFLDTLDARSLQVLLERSHPYSFRAALFDKENGQLGEDMWDLIIENGHRIGYIRIEIPANHGSGDAATLLSFAAPSLRQCEVIVHGSEHLNLSLPSEWDHIFDGSAPQLLSFTCQNCTVSPVDYSLFPNLSELYLIDNSPASPDNFAAVGYSLDGLNLSALRFLVLSSCNLGDGTTIPGAGALDLPLLEFLYIAGIHTPSALLYECLTLPEDCSVKIKLLCPAAADVIFAADTGFAISEFIQFGEQFDHFEADLSKDRQHRIFLSREGRTVEFLFDFTGVEVLHTPAPTFASRIRDIFASIFQTPLLQPDPFLVHLWEAATRAIWPHLLVVYQVKLSFPDDPRCQHPSYITSLVPRLKRTGSLLVEPAHILQTATVGLWLQTHFRSLDSLGITLPKSMGGGVLSNLVSIFELRNAPQRLLVEFLPEPKRPWYVYRTIDDEETAMWKLDRCVSPFGAHAILKDQAPEFPVWQTFYDQIVV